MQPDLQLRGIAVVTKRTFVVAVVVVTVVVVVVTVVVSVVGTTVKVLSGRRKLHLNEEH